MRSGATFIMGTVTSITLLALSGCVGVFTQWGEEISLISHSPSFNPQVLQSERTAVLSAVVGFGLEGYNLQVSRSLSSTLIDAHPAILIVPAHQALSDLNRAGLAKEYAMVFADYKNIGILPRDFLNKVEEALHIRYVFQPSMATFTQTTSGRLSFLGLRLFQTRISILRLSAQLWDTYTGELVWEATGEGTLATEDVREFRIPFEEIATRLWRGILKDLRLQWDVPEEPPPSSSATS